MRALITLAVKDLRLFVRDRVSLLWVLAFPLTLALFFGSMFGGGDGDRSAMKVVVVDQSGGEAADFLRRLGESEALEVDAVGSLEDARDLVRRGDRVAFVHVRPGFRGGGFTVFGRDPDAAAWLGIGVDPARTAERGYLQGLVSQALFTGVTEQLTDPALMQDQIEQTRQSLAQAADLSPDRRRSLGTLMDALEQVNQRGPQTGEPRPPGREATTPSASLTEGLVEAVEVTRDRSGKPRSPYDVTFPSSIVWGLMGCATSFATTIVRERRAGTLLRLRTSPLSRAHVLAGKGLACMLAGLGASAVLLTFGVLVLGVRVADPLLLVVALLAASACFTGLMMIMSVLGKTESAVAGGSWIIMMPLAMIGGGMIPLVAMPPWLLTASHLSPFKWAILAIEGAVWRDFSVPEMLPPLLILLGTAGVLFAAGVAVSKRSDP